MITRKLTGAKPAITLPPGAVDCQTHMYLPGFPALPGGPPNPKGDLPTPAQYRQVMDWLGIDRVVITQGNAQQGDNSNLLACLAEMGDIARGVAAITGHTSDAEMTALSDAGVVGARIMDLPGGAVGLDALEAVGARAGAFGWLMAVQFDGSAIARHADRLAAIGTNWILDHHGKFFAGATPHSPEVDIVKRLIDRGNCWFKFAGCYESTRTGGPDFEDIAAVAREIASYAPDRIVWGTNWPHNLAQTTGDYPDDGALLDTVLSWLPTDQVRAQALVKTPQALFGFPAWTA
ncbi:amidohydrolase family protein [Chachezhania sediminis]|uniref:amidohydrolase family protein n=1 Tax=Chachezhania sediminis TaxID=2599291 RepID=UPI00131C7671|nr:amidohydrolase family protein [Chachezhania sediminis]